MNVRQRCMVARADKFRSAPSLFVAVRPAYTLLEIVLVMAILVILASLVYPSFEAMYSGQKLTDAASKVQAAWATARSRAVNEGRPYRFAALIGKGNFRVAPDSDDYWNGSDSNPAADADAPPLVMDGTLPKGVVFAQGNGPQQTASDVASTTDNVDPSQWSSNAFRVTFLPTGNSLEDAQIVFQTSGTRPVVLKLRALTGMVTMRRLDPGDNQP